MRLNVPVLRRHPAPAYEDAPSILDDTDAALARIDEAIHDTDAFEQLCQIGRTPSAAWPEGSARVDPLPDPVD